MSKPKSPVDVVKAMYESFSRGDVDAVVQLCSPTVVWVNYGAPGEIDNGVYNGRNGVQQFFEDDAKVFNTTVFEVDPDIIAQGSRVCATGKESGTFINTSKTFNSVFAHVFIVENGQVTSFVEYLCVYPEK